MPKILLQGDIKLTECEEPQGVKLVSEKQEHTIAVGEQTGHKHVVRTQDRSQKVKLYQDKEGKTYLYLEGTGTLTHEGTGQEHGTQTLEPLRWYRVGGGLSSESGEREYDYFTEQTRRTID